MALNPCVVTLSCFLILGLPILAVHSAEVIETDVCVYGGASAGVAAAVQTTRMGKRAILVESGRHLGGLSSGGLGATDIGNKSAIGGISREFYARVAKHYANNANWKFEKPQEFFSKRASGQSKASDLTSPEATMWTFEPHVASKLFREMLEEAKV